MDTQIRFEIEHFGVPYHVYPNKRGNYAVLAVDDRYSPRLKLYNLYNGHTGEIKVKKAEYTRHPVKPGEIIYMDNWTKRQAMTYVDGKPQPKPGVFEIWVNNYLPVSRLRKERKEVAQ